MSRLLEEICDNFIETKTANKSDNGEVSFCDSRKTVQRQSNSMRLYLLKEL